MSAGHSDGGARAGSFLWFSEKILPHVISSLLTIVGLISTWFLFGADQMSKIWESQRQKDLAAFQTTLQTQSQKELEIFRNQLSQPNLEYELLLDANPLDQSAPEIITERITVQNTGTDAAQDVHIRIEFIIPISGEAQVTPLREGMGVQLLDPKSVEITISKLQVQDRVSISIPLRRQDILDLGTTAQGFMASQIPVVTCDGNCKSVKIGANAPPQSYYVVQSGDTLGDIANKLDVNAIDLISANGFLNNANANRIYPGQVLAVP